MLPESWGARGCRLLRRRRALSHFVPNHAASNRYGASNQKFEIKLPSPGGNHACIPARILATGRRIWLRRWFQIHGDAIALTGRNGVKFAFIVQDEGTAIRRDHDILGTNDRDLSIGRLPVRRAQNSLRNGKLDITRCLCGKTRSATADRRANYIFLLRKSRGARAQQIHLRRAEFQAKRSAFVSLHRIAGIHGRSYGKIRAVKQRFSRLDDEAQRFCSCGERRQIDEASYE